MFNTNHVRDSLHILNRRLKFRSFKQFNGNAKQVIHQIIKKCFNSKYFCASLGHFNIFYLRDFGISAEDLIKNGYKKEVVDTLRYVLHIYSKHNRITTTINNNKAYDVFSYSPDSLPLLLHSLRMAEAFDLIQIYKPFLEKEIKKYYFNVINTKSGLIKLKKFSSMKDNAIRKSSCYDNCMAAMLKNELNALKLANPFKDYNYKELIKLNFWNGKYFEDDLKSDYVAGDANVFPFWCNIFNEKEMIKKSIAIIQKNNIDKPFPLKYTSRNQGRKKLLLQLLAPNYEGNSIWTNLGVCYIDVVNKVDKKLAKKHVQQYIQIIKKHKTMPELFNPNAVIYKKPLYICDEGMLWGVKLLKHLD